ncbi:hypothetical protein [Streptacidiphilus albus]|uniref:hypothetical protein n=1 Tax=Streptacidiphilus albus TaxID=105425 RepID=UPI00054B02FA|nr:hypothetical protein [Streptacidiphilus albus]
MAAVDPHDPGPVPPGHGCCPGTVGALCPDCRRAARLADIRARVDAETSPSSMPHTWAAMLRDLITEVDRLTSAAGGTRTATLLESAVLLQGTGHDQAAELLLAQALLDDVAPGSPALRPEIHGRIMAGLAQWQRGESPTVVLADPDHPGGDTLLLVGARTDDPGPEPDGAG